MSNEGFELVEPVLPEGETKTRKKSEKKPQPAKNSELGSEILSYRHLDKRVNNPEVGMVTPFTDPDVGKARWKYDPHIDPSLQFDSQRAWTENLIDDALASNDPEQMKQALEALKKAQSPYLNWAGKAEHTSFAVDTVSLHVHERVDPASILAAVRKRMGKEEKSKGKIKALQPGLFDAPFENLPLRDALDFYKHEKGWSNRLIAGDSLLVMNSLLQKESMAGKVQMIYFDPPYGIKYGSNFQPFVNKKDVKDKSDNDLTQEPEMLKAFRDTWELGLHSYLTYLRDRLKLAKELLNESGSVFVQISDENVHHVREILDEIFGQENFISQITMKRASVMFTKKFLKSDVFYLLYYAKDIEKVKYHQLYKSQELQSFADSSGSHLWFYDEEKGRDIKAIPLQKNNILKALQDNKAYSPYGTLGLNAQGTEKQNAFNFHGTDFYPPNGTQWKSSYVGLKTLVKANRVILEGSKIRYKYFYNDLGLTHYYL